MTYGRYYRRRGKRRLDGFIPVGGLLLWIGLLASAFFSYQRPPPETAAETQQHAPVVQQQVFKRPSHPSSSQADGDRAPDAPAQPIAENNAPGGTPQEAIPAEPSTVPQTAPESPDPATSGKQESESAPNAGTQSPAQAVTDSPAEDAASKPASENMPEETSSAHVAQAQFTTGVENREPVDHVDHVFHTQGKPYRRLFYFTQIIGLSGKTVTHRWEYEGRVMAKVSFHIGGSHWRVYSSKHLPSTLTGHWRVVVTDSEGETIKTDSFVYANP